MDEKENAREKIKVLVDKFLSIPKNEIDLMPEEQIKPNWRSQD